MAYKYKVTEAPAPNLAKQGNYKLGDISYSKDGGTKFIVNTVDSETGKVGWKIVNLPNFEKLLEDVDEATLTAKGVYTKTKDDEKWREIYEDLRVIRNKIRTHLRNEYPDEYKRMKTIGMNEEDVEEVSTSGAAGAYLTPYAFRKKGSKSDDEAYKELGYKLVKEKSLPVVRKKLAKVPKAKKVASKYRMKMPSGVVSSLGYTMGEGALGDGADLGPGPKAGPEGVTNNAYTNQFKYKLVPKNKDGTYVQKGAGMIVKKLY